MALIASWQSRALKLGLRLTAQRRLKRIKEVNRETVHDSRKRLRVIEALQPSPPRRIHIATVNEPDCRGEWVLPPRAWCPAGSHGLPHHPTENPGDDPGPPRAIVYFHGGAYILGGPQLYRGVTWRLAQAARAPLLAVAYRLAPEHPYPAALEDALAAVHWLRHNYPGIRLALAGDSAGGGLALGATLALSQHGRPAPCAVAAFSPWTDLSNRGGSIVERAHRDPWLVPELLEPCTRAYLGDTSPRTPFASPLWGELAGLAPTQIHVGTDELLYDDSRRFAERACAQGAAVQLRVWDQMPHAFPIFASILPEARAALAECGEFFEHAWS